MNTARIGDAKCRRWALPPRVGLVYTAGLGLSPYRCAGDAAFTGSRATREKVTCLENSYNYKEGDRQSRIDT